MPAPPNTKANANKIQKPRGTRDHYPEDLLRRRYIAESWRAVSIRHGFEEIDGPTYEQSELYAVKSGEGILGELFQAFSGKSPDEVAAVQESGRGPYALRPEFTPTLARMYAARASSLGGITRWFCVQPFFRAETPQRGRLREFYQWNCDVLGGEHGSADLESLELVIGCLDLFGLTDQVARVQVNNRNWMSDFLDRVGIADESARSGCMNLLDGAAKRDTDSVAKDLFELGLDDIATINVLAAGHAIATPVTAANSEQPLPLAWRIENARDPAKNGTEGIGFYPVDEGPLLSMLKQSAIARWLDVAPNIVRGLAYYTGTVFEVIAEGERAVAGGGRYDNLIELFGGPPTPAVGFGMGDVVLTNLLDDRELMPEGAALRDAIDRIVRTTSLRPEAFVVAPGDEDAQQLIAPLLADLRRGVERQGFAEAMAQGRAALWDADRYDFEQGGVRPLHARATDKSTKNTAKLMKDADRQHARFVVALHGGADEGGKVELRDLDRQHDLTPNDIGVSDEATFSIRPADRHYVGRAVAALLDR